jgi:hypothetical protein
LTALAAFRRPADLGDIVSRVRIDRLKNVNRRRSRRTNWLGLRHFPAIDAAARRARFSAVEIVKILRKQPGGDKLYRSLYPGTVQKWIDLSGEAKDWKKEVKERVEKEGQRNINALRLGRPRALVRLVSIFHCRNNTLIDVCIVA